MPQLPFQAAVALSLLGSVALAQERPLSADQIFRKVSAGIVKISTSDGFGSGVLIDETGVIVTNLHVIRGQNAARVRFANGDAYDDISVVDVDAGKDLALVRIKGFKLPSVALGDSEQIAIGHSVYAIGTPKDLELTISEGIVSGLRDTGKGYRAIQTSAAISPGSSGGGLFDSRGTLIGITTYKIRGGENLNFALPINYVRGMLVGTATSMTLAEMNARLDDAERDSRTPNSSIRTKSGRVPRFAKVYTASGGVMAVIEESGADEHVRISFSYPDGRIYAGAQLSWSEAVKGFLGVGTVKTACGQFDNRVWDAPFELEFYVVNDQVIRERWKQPAKVNCSRQKITSYSSSQEILWSVPVER